MRSSFIVLSLVTIACAPTPVRRAMVGEEPADADGIVEPLPDAGPAGGAGGSGGSPVDARGGSGGAPDAARDQALSPAERPDAALMRDTAPAEPDAGAPDLVAVDLPPPPGALLVVATPNAVSAGDARVREFLTARGFAVRMADDNTSAAASATGAAGMALVVISSNVAGDTLLAKYRDVAVPAVVLESAVFDDMGMTAGTADTDYQEADGTQITILQPDHALAAGLSGVVTVLTATDGLHWGRPNAASIQVASFQGMANKVAIFAYEKGAMLFGTNRVAPARRVGFFLSFTAATRMTPDAEKLFGAAIDWAVTPPPAVPVIPPNAQ